MLDFRSIELADFSGGITDYPINSPINRFEELDNIVLDPNSKALQRMGSAPFIVDLPDIPTLSRIHNVVGLQNTQLFVAVEDQIFYDTSPTYTELLGIASVSAFSTGSVNVQSSFAEWNGHLFATNTEFALPIKIFRDSLAVPQVRTAGLPAPAAYTVTAAAGAASYIYYIVFTYTYQVGNVTFEDISAPTAFQLINAAVINGGSPASVGPGNTVPTVVNAGGSSYDVSVITVDIYRTVNGGTVAYLVTSISPQSSTTYSDTMDDATLQLQPVLYTSLGIQEYDSPPLAKYIHIMNGRAYYAYTKDPGTNEEFPFRVYQSIQDDPDSVPEAFYFEVRDVITGISSYANNVIVFGQDHVYRVDGYFDELGRNGPTYEEVSKVTGCVSMNSIVQTDFGVFFAGTTGFYFTDGMRFFKVSDLINDRYKNIVADAAVAKRIFGTYDAVNLKVYWAVARFPGETDNDSIFCLDLRYPFEKNGVFTTWSNGTYFQPSAICMYQKDLIRADPRGYVFKHNDLFATDPRIDTLANYVDWGTKAIIYTIKTAHMNLELPQIRKWVTRVLATFKYLSNLSVSLISINDVEASKFYLREIRWRGLLTWGDPDPIWGDDSLIWNETGLVEQWRRFPKNTLRCSYKQIEITNAYTIIYRSDDQGTLTFDLNTFVAHLDDFERTLSIPDCIFLNGTNTGVVIGDVVTGDTTTGVGTVIDIRNVGTQLVVLVTAGSFTGETGVTSGGGTFAVSQVFGPASPLGGFNVGDSVLGVNTGATGTITAIGQTTVDITTTSGDFTGETILNDVPNSAFAPVDAVSALGTWANDLLDYYLVLHPNSDTDPDDYPVTLPILQRIDNYNLLVSDPNGTLVGWTQADFNSCKWYIKGFPKNEVMNMMSLVLYYAPLTPSQRTFQNFQTDAGYNQP